MAAAFACAWLTASTGARAGDALVDKLVEKGLLTQEEAADLKEQEFKETRDTFPGTKIKIASWLDELSFNGDVRTRAEFFTGQKVVRTDGRPGGAPHYETIEDRTRFRYRLRLGAEATAGDFRAGVRLMSGSGDPVSGNQTMGATFSKKPINIDLAYLAWNPSFFNEMTIVAGKMENPFFSTPLVYDPDLTPEGISEQFK
ncbi:MAG: putative porin, partial [Verrucomicrobiae bacterium]|nr:putative porin [Verrucomicrobiae bacterium]